MATLYQIRDPDTGLYSTGDSAPGWSKTGKVWNGLGPLKNHLTPFLAENVYRNAEVVVLELKETGTITVAEMQAEVSQKREKKRQREEEKRLLWRANLAKDRTPE